MLEVSASYKKQDGKLQILPNGRSVSWRANNSSTSPLTILASDIKNLQQTPETSAKASIRISVPKLSPASNELENHTFTFTSPNARAEQVTTTALLRKGIETARAQTGDAAVPAANDGGGQSAAMAIAQAVSAGARTDENTFEDSRLVANADLQKSLLNANPTLRQRFEQALRDKPENITITQFATQFWAARVHLLRSHAVEKSQSQGTYNVLSEVKPKNVDGTTKLNLSKEQIQLIFNQHPLVKKVYNENVPQLSEMDFWARFFVSRLFKRLKGEKITDADSVDPKLDKYLNYEDEAERTKQLIMSRVPHFIDLEGNEQNHSQRQGNRLDFTMQPNAHDKVPILRVLNTMSEKMMADVAPTDVDPHAPAGMDEDTYKELQLRDLQRAAEDNRVMLKIKNQGQFFSAEQGSRNSNSTSMYGKRSPNQTLSIISRDSKDLFAIENGSSKLNLQSAIGVDASSSSEEEGANKKLRVGSKSARTAATTQIVGAIRQQHLHDDYASSSGMSPGEQAAKLGLTQTVFETLTMTHNTTVEFLHYFWTVFFSGDVDRAGEAQKLIETLDKCLDRINAVAETAEKDRNGKVEDQKKQLELLFKRTGKRRKIDPSSIAGGARAVKDMMAPIIQAIKTATDEYKRAYEAQMAQMAQLQNIQV